MSNLTGLELDNNALTAVPSELGNPTGLERLYLNDNMLTSLPPELGNLTSLRRLEVNGNQLTELPSALGTMTSLTAVTLHEHQLSGDITEPLAGLFGQVRLLHPTSASDLPVGSLGRRLDEERGERLTTREPIVGVLSIEGVWK